MHHFYFSSLDSFDILKYNWNNLFFPSETVENTIPVTSVARDGSTAIITVTTSPHGCEPGDIVTYVEESETGEATYIGSNSLSIPSLNVGSSSGGNLSVPDRPTSLADLSGSNSLDVRAGYIGYGGSMLNGRLRMARSSRYEMVPEAIDSDTLYFALVVEFLENLNDRVGDNYFLQVDSGTNGLGLYASSTNNSLVLQARQGANSYIEYKEPMSMGQRYLIEILWDQKDVLLFINGLPRGFRVSEGAPTSMSNLYISNGQYEGTDSSTNGFIHYLDFIGISKSNLRTDPKFVKGLCRQYEISYDPPTAIEGVAGLPVEGPATFNDVDLWIDFTRDELKSVVGDEIIEIEPRVNNGGWSNFYSYSKGPQNQGVNGISFDGVTETLIGRRETPYNTDFTVTGSTWIVIFADYDPSTATNDSSFMHFVNQGSTTDYAGGGARILGKDFGNNKVELAYNAKAGSEVDSPASGVVWAIVQRASTTVLAYNVTSDGQTPAASSRGYSTAFAGQELSFGRFFGNDSCKFRILHAVLINDLLTDAEVNAFSTWIEATGVDWTDL